jgi:hypothetical protein
MQSTVLSNGRSVSEGPKLQKDFAENHVRDTVKLNPEN